MNDKGGTGEQTPSSILVYIRLEITLGATQQAEAAVFREMRPRGRSFVGSAARISRDVCLAAEGRDSADSTSQQLTCSTSICCCRRCSVPKTHKKGNQTGFK